MYLNFLSDQCLLPESFFRFLIEFMLTHKGFFCSMCNSSLLSKFPHIYVAGYALFQIIYAVKELTGLLQNKDGPNHTVMFNIPYLQVPITHHDFRLVKFTIGISSFIDLFLNITSEHSRTQELVNFTGISLLTILFSLYKLIMDAPKLTQRNKNIKILFLVGSTVNVLFLTCHLFQQYKHCDVSNVATIQLNN